MALVQRAPLTNFRGANRLGAVRGTIRGDIGRARPDVRRATRGVNAGARRQFGAGYRACTAP